MPDKRPRKRTTDERIDAIAMNLELLSHQVQDLAKQTTHNFELALDSIKRLENIALAHEHRFDDHERRLDDLEHGQ